MRRRRSRLGLLPSPFGAMPWALALGKPQREHAAGATCANDDIVELVHFPASWRSIRDNLST